MLSVTRIVVAQTFLELHCELDKGLVRFGFGFVVVLCLGVFCVQWLVLFWLGFLDFVWEFTYIFFLNFFLS